MATPNMSTNPSINRNDIVNRLKKREQEAQEKYDRELAKDFPPLWATFIIPSLGACAVSVLLEFILPDSLHFLLLQKGSGPASEFGRAPHFAIPLFFLMFLPMLMLRKKNGADPEALQKASRELEENRFSVNTLLCLEAEANLSAVRAEHDQLVLEHARTKAENDLLRDQLARLKEQRAKMLRGRDRASPKKGAFDMNAVMGSTMGDLKTIFDRN